MQNFMWLLNAEKLLKYMIENYGYIGLAAVVFTETGLLAGFFLPGDSLLFAAGLACAPKNSFDLQLDLVSLNLWLIPAAIIGDAVGFWIGRAFGAALYNREKTLFFRKDHLLQTKAFYEKHGGKTIVMARFVPIIRTFAPVVAGIAQMPYWNFAMYNVFGGIGWVAGLTLLGYYLGGIEVVKKNVEVSILLVIFISILPPIISFLKNRSKPSVGATPEVNS